MNRISKHITYKEAVRSKTAIKLGIDNTPDKEQLLNMKAIAEAIFEPLRAHFGVPIYISSFFRSKKLNKKIHGSKTSQHLALHFSAAMDLDDVLKRGVLNSLIFQFIKDNLEFDQLIWEFGDDNEPDWVHVSYKRIGYNRMQVLRAKKDSNNKTYYEAA